MGKYLVDARGDVNHCGSKCIRHGSSSRRGSPLAAFWLTAALVAVPTFVYFEFVVIVGTAYSAIGYIALVFFGYWLLKLAISSQPR